METAFDHCKSQTLIATKANHYVSAGDTSVMELACAAPKDRMPGFTGQGRP
ncbi:MAG: hypothetical protein ACLT0Y_04110 [Christensenellales bacterium]